MFGACPKFNKREYNEKLYEIELEFVNTLFAHLDKDTRHFYISRSRDERSVAHYAFLLHELAIDLFCLGKPDIAINLARKIAKYSKRESAEALSGLAGETLAHGNPPDIKAAKDLMKLSFKLLPDRPCDCRSTVAELIRQHQANQNRMRR